MLVVLWHRWNCKGWCSVMIAAVRPWWGVIYRHCPDRKKYLSRWHRLVFWLGRLSHWGCCQEGKCRETPPCLIASSLESHSRQRLVNKNRMWHSLKSCSVGSHQTSYQQGGQPTQFSIRGFISNPPPTTELESCELIDRSNYSKQLQLCVRQSQLFRSFQFCEMFCLQMSCFTVD